MVFVVIIIVVVYRRQRYKSKPNHASIINSDALNENYVYADTRGLIPNRGSIVNPYQFKEDPSETMPGEIWRVNPLYMEVEDMEENGEVLDSTTQQEGVPYQEEEQEEKEELEDKPVPLGDWR